MGHYTCRIWPILSFTEISGYLEAMEGRGLRFRRIRCFGLLAEYETGKPAETQYCWDYFEPELYRDIQPYLELCADSGWEIAWQFKKHKIFRRSDNPASCADSSSASCGGSITGSYTRNHSTNYTADKETGRALPVQSDEGFYRENCRKASRNEERKSLLSSLICLLIWAVIFSTMVRLDMVYTSAWSLLLWTVLPLPVFAVSALWYLRQWIGHTFSPGCRSIRRSPAWYRLLAAGRLLAVIAVGVSCAAASVNSFQDKSGNIFLAILPGVLVLSLPLGRYREQVKCSEGYPQGERMKGVFWVDPESCRRRQAAAWCLFAVWIVAGLFFSFRYFELDKPIRTSGFYCEEIYAESREESAGRYYRARNEAWAEKIAYIIAHSAESWGGPMQITKEEAERLRAESFAIGGHTLPEEGWDEAWRIFRGGGLVVVRKGAEVWYVME